MRREWLAALALIPLLAACSSKPAGGKVESASPAVTRPIPRSSLRRPVRRPPPPAQVLALPGLEGVIGSTAAQLAQQFGTARLDVWEGDARKLQFTGAACILDIFLYPGTAGREPQATYIDARRSDGREVDRLACVSAMRRR